MLASPIGRVLTPTLGHGRLWILALLVMLLHLSVIGEYGVFRDEFYYLACGRHLDWGYVDHPPAVAALARVSSWFGDSVLAIRAGPLLLSGLLVLVVGAITSELGGSTLAQWLAAGAVSLAPHFLFVFHFLSMNCLEVVLWALALWLLLIAVQRERSWAWIAMGVVCGVGLLTKHSMAVLGAAIAVALLVTPARKQLATRWPWLGGLIAIVLFTPHVLWQIAHDWPTAEFVRNAQQHKIAAQSIGSFVFEFVGMAGPVSLPLWVLGWWMLLRGSSGRAARPLGIIAIVVLLVFFVQRSKPYYVTPILPVLFAAGAVQLERISALRRWLRWVLVAVGLVGAAAIAPLGLPILPVDLYLRYTAALGITPTNQERQELGALPQHFADMHGWETIAQSISAIYTSLPENERATARVWCRNYGEAGALEYFAARYPLPQAISPHNNYWYWGPGPDDGTLIVIDGDREDLDGLFESVELVGATECDLCMPYERGRPLWVCRGWKVPLKELWPTEKFFI